MLLVATEIIDRPIEEVFPLVRDNLVDLVPYMANVGKIELIDKQDSNGFTHITNHWYALAEVPGLLKKVINPDILSWKDVAVWDNENFKVDYSLESFLANDLFDAKGTNTFSAISETQTQLKLHCEVEIYADRVPGVPRLLAKKATPMIEGLIKKILTPNLTALGKGLNEYFAEN
jgi:hypothetical protein